MKFIAIFGLVVLTQMTSWGQAKADSTPQQTSAQLSYIVYLTNANTKTAATLASQITSTQNSIYGSTPQAGCVLTVSDVEYFSASDASLMHVPADSVQVVFSETCKSASSSYSSNQDLHDKAADAAQKLIPTLGWQLGSDPHLPVGGPVGAVTGNN